MIQPEFPRSAEMWRSVLAVTGLVAGTLILQASAEITPPAAEGFIHEELVLAGGTDTETKIK